MNNMKNNPLVRKLVARLPLWRAFTVPATLVAVGLALSPVAHAVLPPPDGGYPGFNTAEGDDALFSLTTGTDDTASGFDAMYNITTDSDNTASGYLALFSNNIGIDNTAASSYALTANVSGNYNTGTGRNALRFNSTGQNNTTTGSMRSCSITAARIQRPGVIAL